MISLDLSHREISLLIRCDGYGRGPAGQRRQTVAAGPRYEEDEMRMKRRPRHGDLRTVVKFLFWPCELRNVSLGQYINGGPTVRKWPEFADIIQEWDWSWPWENRCWGDAAALERLEAHIKNQRVTDQEYYAKLYSKQSEQQLCEYCGLELQKCGCGAAQL